MSARRVAAIDIGTVTTRLLVADVDLAATPATISEVERSTDITHLGEDLTSTGRLAPGAMERVRDVISAYAGRIETLEVDAWAAVATSASRDAANGGEFLGLLEGAGIRPQIIAGPTEAALSFRGATHGTGATDVLVDDVGGGSTELVLGSEDPGAAGGVRIDAARSIDVGSRRITELFVESDPPTGAELERAKRFANDAFEAYFASLPRPPRDVISVAGTATSLVSVKLAMATYDPAVVHGHRLGRAEIREVRERLASLTLEQRRDVVGLHPDRASVIVAGALILEAVLEGAGLDSTLVSERDILYGILLEAADSRERGNVQVGV